MFSSNLTKLQSLIVFYICKSIQLSVFELKNFQHFEKSFYILSFQVYHTRLLALSSNELLVIQSFCLTQTLSDIKQSFDVPPLNI